MVTVVLFEHHSATDTPAHLQMIAKIYIYKNIINTGQKNTVMHLPHINFKVQQFLQFYKSKQP